MVDERLVEEFSKLMQNPEEVKRLQRKTSQDEFRGKYNVERASPLHCPACSEAGFTGGTLWFNKDIPTKCVCHKCHLEWNVECLTTPTEELIRKIREASK